MPAEISRRAPSRPPRRPRAPGPTAACPRARPPRPTASTSGWSAATPRRRPRNADALVRLGRDVGRVGVEVERDDPVGVVGQPEHGERPAPHLDREDLEELDLRHEHARQRVAPLGQRPGALEDRKVAARHPRRHRSSGRRCGRPRSGAARCPPSPSAPATSAAAPRGRRRSARARARLHREGGAGGAQALGEQQRAAAQAETLVGPQERPHGVLGHPAHGLVVGLLAAALDDVALEHAHPVDVGVVDRQRLAVHLVGEAARRPRRPGRRGALEPDRQRRREQIQLLVVEEPVGGHDYQRQTAGMAGWSGAGYFLWIGCTTSSPNRRICSAAISSEGPSTSGSAS